MKTGIKLIVLLLMLQSSVALAVKKDFDVDKLRQDLPAWFMSTDLLDLSEAVADARDNGKQGVFVVVGTEGCSYCYKFYTSSLHDPEIGGLLQKDFDAVGFEMFDDKEIVDPKGEQISIKKFVKREGTNFTPTIMFYDTDGNQVFRKSGYQSPERFVKIMQYVREQHYKNTSFTAFINNAEKKMATTALPLMNNHHFQSGPYALNRKQMAAARPMMVLFESANCKGCVDFHKEVLTEPEVDKTLQKFDVVRMEISDNSTPVITPAGDKLTPLSWYKSEDFNHLPAYLFIDENGNTGLKTDTFIGRSRIMNSLNYMLEKAYEKGWTYQRFARSQSIKRNQAKSTNTQ